MTIKIKFPQKELKRRVALLLDIEPKQVLFVSPTMGGKSFMASIRQYAYGRDAECCKIFTIWQIIDCLPLDDVAADWFSAKGLIAELKECLTLLGLSEYPKKVSELKFAYRQKAKEVHPDKGGNPELFREVKIAYEKLKAHHGGFFAQNQ